MAPGNSTGLDFRKNFFKSLEDVTSNTAKPKVSAFEKYRTGEQLSPDDPDILKWAERYGEAKEPPNFGAGVDPREYIARTEEWFEDQPIGRIVSLGDWESTSTTPHTLKSMIRHMKKGRVKLLPYDGTMATTNDLGLLYGNDAKLAFDERLDRLFKLNPDLSYIPYSEATVGSNKLNVPAL